MVGNPMNNGNRLSAAGARRAIRYSIVTVEPSSER